MTVDVYHKNCLFSCEYIGCHKTFATKYGLKMHTDTHTKSERFLCPHCGNRYSYKSTFDAHLAKHAGIKPYSCALCNKKFTNSSNLSTHKGLCGVKTQPEKCQNCGKRFKASRYLKEHMKLHTSQDYLVCDVCGEHYSSRGGLYNHKLRKH
jgi:KRAB domain-containing zinc finger protein